MEYEGADIVTFCSTYEGFGLPPLEAMACGAPCVLSDLPWVRELIEPERGRLDLGRWRVAGNAAEPVHRETIERFAETFAPCGFRGEAFYPCYGLAEATLFVSGPPASRRSTRTSGSSLRRLARTQPAEPAPTIT